MEFVSSHKMPGEEMTGSQILDDLRTATSSKSLPVAQWRLTGRSQPEEAVQEIAIWRQPFSVGRRDENQLCLSNSTVSGRHAELIATGETLILKDLNSTNGTFLNGVRIKDVGVVQDGDRIQFGTASFTIRKESGLPSTATVMADAAGVALAHHQFDRLLDDPAVEPHYQPIVQFSDGKCIGYEVLARSSLVGLETPASMFRVAAERNLESELSCLLRSEGLRLGQEFSAKLQLFVNTHPSELKDERLIESLHRLRETFPNLHVVLEVHESAVTSSSDLAELRDRLQILGIGLSYDDFGAGQARFMELVDVPPDVIKFDMKLIRDIDSASEEQKELVASLVRLSKKLGVKALAEGIETEAEANACRELDFDLAQGFFFGRPSPAKTWIVENEEKKKSDS